MPIHAEKKEWRERICSLCGESYGGSFNHSECAKIKQELYGKESETKSPRKKLSKKQADALGKYYSEL